MIDSYSCRSAYTTDAIHEAGFLIERLVEPMPDPGLSQRDPDSYRSIMTQPCFLFFRLTPVRRCH